MTYALKSCEKTIGQPRFRWEWHQKRDDSLRNMTSLCTNCTRIRRKIVEKRLIPFICNISNYWALLPTPSWNFMIMWNLCLKLTEMLVPSPGLLSCPLPGLPNKMWMLYNSFSCQTSGIASLFRCFVEELPIKTLLGFINEHFVSHWNWWTAQNKQRKNCNLQKLMIEVYKSLNLENFSFLWDLYSQGKKRITTWEAKHITKHNCVYK